MFFPALFQGKILAPLDITTSLLAPWKAENPSLKPHNHYPVDAVTQYLPYRLFAEKSLREDGYIGWNPYEMGGCNLAANTMALPSAWTMQLHRFLPFTDAWNFGLLAEFLTAGIGMVVFLRSRSLPWLACAVGAIIFTANSQFTIWVYHRWALGAFCWMPWILWSAVELGNWQRVTLRLWLLPLFLALALLGGTLQHSAFVVIACGCLFAGSIKNFRKPTTALPTATLWALAFSIALALSAFSWIPQVQAYLANNALGHSRGGIGYEKGTLQPLYQCLIIPIQIWPWLIGDPSTIDGLRIIKCGFMDLAYLGTTPMVLALIGLFRKNMPCQAKWLIALGLLIPLTPLVGPLYHRVQLLFLLGAAWMCAEMLKDCIEHPSIVLRKYLPLAVAALGIFLLGASLLPSGSRKALEQKVVTASLKATANSVLAEDRPWIQSRALGWTRRFSLFHPRTAWTYGLLVLGTLGGMAICSRNARVTGWGVPLIGASASLELLTFFHAWCTFSDPREIQPKNSSIDRVREIAGASKVYQLAGGEVFTHQFAPPNLLAARFIPSADAYESIQSQTMFRTMEDLPEAQKLTLAGVGVAVHSARRPVKPGLETWLIKDTVSGFVIRTNPEVLPKILAGQGPLPSSKDSLMPTLKSATEVSQTKQTMNRLEITSPGDVSWLRIAQNWHAGWKWRSPGGDWNSFASGPDSACWIPNPPLVKGALEIQFFPRPMWLVGVSSIMATAWLFFAMFRGWSHIWGSSKPSSRQS